MLSVIIPTMWRYKPFPSLLEKLVELDCIQEIIIINNDVSKTPQEKVLEHQKIRVYNSSTNLFVNPSWNLGARLATCDKLAFFSDDVDVNLLVFEKAEQFMNEETGMIGILASYHDHEEAYNRFLIDDTINFVWCDEPDSEKRPPPIGIGSLFFLNKKDWKDIPEDIKIFHGEVMQWNRIALTKKNYIITNCRIYTPWHVTWKDLSDDPKFAEEFSKLQNSDQKLSHERCLIF